MSAVGRMLRDSLDARVDAHCSFDVGTTPPVCPPLVSDAYAELGRAYGRAFRAAELAYDLGQRHAVEGERRRLATALEEAAQEASDQQEMMAWAYLKDAADELRGVD